MTRTKNYYICLSLVFVLLGVGGSAVAAPAVPPAAVETAKAYFKTALADDTKLPFVLAGLKSTEDEALLPLFTTLMRSGRKEVRMLAAAMVADIGGVEAAEALRERLDKDTAMAIRAKALIELDRLKAISPGQLLDAMKIDDEEVQLLAARALARMGQAAKARPVLYKLTKSRDRETAVFARMTLLGAGDRTQIGPIKKFIIDPATTQQLLIFLLNQICQENISAALPVADFLSWPDKSTSVRIRAYLAISDLSPKAALQIAKAIRASDNPFFRINILRILAERNDAQTILPQFAQGDSILAAVTRFELARAKGGPAATKAVAELFEMGHPIVVEYVLNRMRKDVEEKKAAADFYTKPVLKYIRSVELNPHRMTPEHDRVAMAVELLGNLGTADAIKGIWEILDQADNDTTRKLTAGALYRCDNKAVCDLVRPLLKSPFSDLKTYAALLLARNGDPQAIPALLEIQQAAKTHKADVLTLTNWYLLKLAGQAKPAAAELGKSVP